MEPAPRPVEMVRFPKSRVKRLDMEEIFPAEMRAEDMLAFAERRIGAAIAERLFNFNKYVIERQPDGTVKLKASIEVIVPHFTHEVWP